jgi:DNA-binding transcriptional LysR family regulator
MMELNNRITLQKLEVFELVIELGSVSRAGDRLFVAQPVVTAHIRSLEQRLGVKLFVREGRQLELTEAGEAVHGWASEVMRRGRELSRTLDGLADGTRGSVALAANMSLGSYTLPPILARFRRARPAVQVRVSIRDFRQSLADVEAAENDFAVIAMDWDPSGSELVGERLGEDELVLVSSPRGEPPTDRVSPAELGSLPFVEIWHQRPFDRRLRQLGLGDRRVVIELGHPEAVKRAVKEGVGVSILFRTSVQDELDRGELREVVVQGVDLAVPVYLIYRRDKVFSRAQRELMDVIRANWRGAGVQRLPLSGVM